MPTIAELELKLDSRHIKEGTDSLNSFADAAERAGKAGKDFGKDTTGSGGLAPTTETNKVKNLSEAIDQQTRKLSTLAQQRKALESSDMKSTMPAEYERLNRIIDANIQKVVKQGSAVEQLKRTNDKEAESAVNKANAKLRMEERLADSAVRQENVITNAAARQQRQIDQTINGLSRQIKAQNEYNEAVNKLNLARTVGGTSAGMMGSTMGGEEYDTLLKLAQARRDAAFATEDNSRALQAAQNKLDTFTATLGKAERAEVQFGRAIRTLDENLENGNITLDQYNAKLAQFEAHRDKAVAAANSEVAAEERLERQLRQVMGAYDPVLRAQEQYNNSVRILSDGLQNGVISANQFNKALTEQRIALDNVKDAQSGSTQLKNNYDSALNSLVPYRNELKQLELQEQRLEAAQKAGLVVTDQQKTEHANATKQIAAQRAEYARLAAQTDKNTMSAKAQAAAMRGLPAQFTDIVVSLQGGQAPLTVLLQQGGQIKDMFGGIGPALQAMGKGLMALISPLWLTVGAIAAVAAAAHSGSEEMVAFSRAMIQTRGVSGASASDFTTFQNQLDGIAGTSGKAAEALTQMAASGKITSGIFVDVAEAAIKTEKATGTAMSSIIDDFTSLGKDPVDAAVRLDEKYRFLTASVLAQAQALVQQGQEQQAVTLLQSEMAAAASDAADKMIEEAGYIERAWAGVKSIVTETWDALKGIGREDTTQSRIDALLKVQSNLVDSKGQYSAEKDSRYQEAAAQIRILEQRKTAEKSVADQRKQDELDRQASVSATAAALKRNESGLKGVEKAENDLKKVRQENERINKGGNVSSELSAVMAANEARAVKELAEAKEKANKPKPPGALDTTSIQEVKSNLTQINAEYDGYYKRITALGEANVVSQEATYNSQKAILEAQKKAVIGSYDDQISAIKNLREQKKNSNAQNISLDNQLTKAEAAKAKAMEDIDTRMDVLQAKENGRIQERTRNISAYKAALDAQLESLRDEGARNADGVGRGSRQAGLNQRLGDNDRDFDKKQMALANALAAKDIDDIEYAEKLKDLERAHSDMTKQIVQNDKDIQRANQDWTNGFTSAVEDAQDAGVNFAGSVNEALTGAFQSAGDALYEFVTTGKLSFSDFASSVIKDMARIASQQAASGLLSSLLGLGATVAGAYFGGGAATTSGVSGANSFGQIGGSYTGTGVFVTQSKGGAWDSGVQRFAKGGTFTNSVVSSPTRFKMNGGEGEMGEAGPEGILPLMRTSDGRLGVIASGMGDGGGGGNTTIVNVNVAVADGKSSSSSDGGSGYDEFGQQLGAFVVEKVYTVINKETRPGGTIQPQS